MPIRLIFAAVLAASLAAAGAAPARDVGAGALRIGHPWSLPVPAGAPTAAGYLTVANTGKTADRLIGAESPDVDHVYTMDHSTTVYLMDRKGRFADAIGYKEPDADAVAKLRSLAQG